MDKNLRKQLAIATSLQLVDHRKRHSVVGHAEAASQAVGQIAAGPPVLPDERRVSKRLPVRHAGLNE